MDEQLFMRRVSDVQRALAELVYAVSAGHAAKDSLISLAEDVHKEADTLVQVVKE